LKDLIAGLPEKTDKQLRTIRNNLNNRIASIKNEDKGLGKAKIISKSHMLFGMQRNQLEEFLTAVKRELKKR
jgi:hypothetical protein